MINDKKNGKHIFVLLFFLFISIMMLAQNVGIGIPNPLYKLDVAGRMRIRTGTLNNASTSSGIWLEDFRDGTNRVFFGMMDSIRAGFYGTGTGGVGWDFNFNAKTGDINLINGSLGIGTNAPAYDVTISRSTPRIGFHDVDEDIYSGYIYGQSADLYVSAFRRSSLGTATAGNLLLQTNSGGIPNFIAGNVGIGTTAPDVKVHIMGGTDATGNTGGYLQIGSSTSTNIAFDNDEIQARNDGVASKLYLQMSGGGAQFGSNAASVTLVGSEVQKTATGSANMLPLAYGKVSLSGAILSGSGNFTVSKPSEGVYKITLPGESNLFSNQEDYTLVFSTNAGQFETTPAMISSAILDDNKIEVRITKPWLYWTNSSCSGDCGPFSYITGFLFHDMQDRPFSFIIYKP
jgi:hypothetical protein